MGVGLALGLTYMTRYEAIAPAVGVTVLVLIVTWAQTRGTRSARLAAAGNDVALVAGPFVFAFALWSAMAKILVGQWLPTFSSTSGNSAQVSSGARSIQSVTGDTASAILAYIGRQIQGLAPLFVVLLVAAAMLAIRARNLPALAAPVVFGAVSAFHALVLLKGSSFGWLRFQITVIPLTALLAGTVVALGLHETRRRGWWMPHGDGTAPAAARTVRGRRSAAVVGTGLVAVAVAVSIPVQVSTLTDTRQRAGPRGKPDAALGPLPDLATHEERRSLLIFHTERQIAAYIDYLDPGDGHGADRHCVRLLGGHGQHPAPAVRDHLRPGLHRRRRRPHRTPGEIPARTRPGARRRRRPTDPVAGPVPRTGRASAPWYEPSRARSSATGGCTGSTDRRPVDDAGRRPGAWARTTTSVSGNCGPRHR